MNVSNAQKISGTTYAISQYTYAARCTGFRYHRDMAQAFDIDMHDGMTMQELEDAGEILKRHEVYLTANGLSKELSYMFFCSMELFGESGACGVIMDPAQNAEIINIYDSDELREYFRTVRKWYEAGYLPEDQMLDEVGSIRLYSEGKLFGMPTNVTAGQMGAGGSFDKNSALITLSDPVITTSSAGEFMLGIASTCKNPEAAMDFINLIYENPDVANLLNYGVEGLDYEAVPGTQKMKVIFLNAITYPRWHLKKPKGSSMFSTEEIGIGGSAYLFRKTGNTWLTAMLMGTVAALMCVLFGQLRFM